MFPALLVLMDSVATESFEGVACETSADCGTLKCIDDRCRDITTLRRGEHPVWSRSIGDRGMFGDGQSYGTTIAVIDIVATLTEPFLMLGAVSSAAPTSTIYGIICFAPVGFAGPIVHLINGRPIPALISFFAWTSLAGSTFVVGGLFGLAVPRGGEFNSVAAWTGGLLFGAAGAVAFTYLDVWMARSVTPSKKPATESGMRFAPSIAPTRGGAMALLGGRF